MNVPSEEVQRIIVKKMVPISIGVEIIAFYLAFKSMKPLAGLERLTGRIAFALQRNAVAALPLIAGIQVVGMQRLYSPAINPLNEEAEESTAFKVNARFVSNTTEQLLLFSIVNAAASVYDIDGRISLLATYSFV